MHNEVSLFIGNNTSVELRDLTNSITAALDLGATVECRVQDLDGTDITGQTWPLSMPHVAGGLYRGILDPTLSLVEGNHYIVKINATGSASEVGQWEADVIAKRRGKGD